MQVWRCSRLAAATASRRHWPEQASEKPELDLAPLSHEQQQVAWVEWRELCTLVRTEWRSDPGMRTHVGSALRLLQNALVAVLGAPCLQKLREPTVLFLARYASELHSEAQRRGLARVTLCNLLSKARRILARAGASEAALRATRPVRPRGRTTELLGAPSLQGLAEPCRRRLQAWSETLRAKTGNQSVRSLQDCLGFVLRCVLPHLGLSLEEWPEDGSQQEAQVKQEEPVKREPQEEPRTRQLHPRLREAAARCTDEQTIRALCAAGDVRGIHKKFAFLQAFVTHLLGVQEASLPRATLRAMVRELRRRLPPDDNVDRHRIPKHELERLYAAACGALWQNQEVPATADPPGEQRKRPRAAPYRGDELDELLFLTLLTTGMRIGGFVNMKCSDVALVREGRWVAREQGKTLEKGRKLFTFHLHLRVRELLERWLNVRRPPTDLDFVFPGREAGHVSRGCFALRFKRLCAAAGLQGKHLHLHALRHSFSHILLELGNSVETVTRLINHESTLTTQKYYLRESPAQVAQRATIPWLDAAPKAKESPVPAFLQQTVLPATQRLSAAERIQRASDLCAELDRLESAG